MWDVDEKNVVAGKDRRETQDGWLPQGRRLELALESVLSGPALEDL